MARTKSLQGGVSVVIPVRNGEKQIAGCIESALDQSGIVREVIVVDRNSSDETVSVALSMGDPRVRVVCLEHCGFDEAAKTGAKEASGAWLYIFRSMKPLPKDSLLSEEEAYSLVPAAELAI